ncbi:DNA-binding domain-containing protein [Thioclava pacifica]|uniref:Putative DNA-binding domain-containing protein n=1 Tax=Thioclava pacifica DSM 10166 TaxID=1353537 RepID=A0A074JFG1_9RHOB|nr:DNA-binding domain-containing protein [Thioclava pacifica]KEO54323.1 hypothetical protein TP2_05190 [Thioclava pacifica DSM 10166]
MLSHRDFARSFRDAINGGAAPENATARQPGETERRFDVYRNNVAHGLSRALARHYPVIERLLGDECFKGVARLFIDRHPPQTPLLIAWGEEFAAFLAEIETFQSLIYLPDVARIEWARSRAYHSSDAQPVPPQKLQAIAQEAGEDLQLFLHPSVQVLQMLTPAGSIWVSQQPGGPPAPTAAQWAPETVLIARKGLDDVITQAVPAPIGRFISALAYGRTVAEAQASTGEGFELNAAFLLLVKNALIIGADKKGGDTT